MKSSGIGGQAVIEGIMMKNNDKYSIAVRKPDKEILVIEKEYVATTKKHPALNIPIIRGVVNFVDSMKIGISTLTYSSSFYEEEEDAKPTKFDEFAGKLFKDKLESVIMGFTVVMSVIIAIALFMVLPYGVSRLFSKVISSVTVLNVIEGITRLLIFLIYVLLISQMEDIKRVFMYHGAEHKCINCIENGHELTVENVRLSSRVHKRCGTSFMLFIMIISIILFMFIQFDNKLLNLVMRIVLVPVIAGISYEVLKLAGNSANRFIGIISAPGLWLQKLTTKEPDDDMIEVAIAAIEKVFDWKKYLSENSEESSGKKAVDMEKIDSINSIDDINDIFENNDDLPPEEEKAQEKELTPPKKRKRGKKAKAAKKAASADKALDEVNEETSVTTNEEVSFSIDESDSETVEDTASMVEETIADVTTETKETLEETSVKTEEIIDNITEEVSQAIEVNEEEQEDNEESVADLIRNISDNIKNMKEKAAAEEVKTEEAVFEEVVFEDIIEEEDLEIKEFVQIEKLPKRRSYNKIERKKR